MLSRRVQLQLFPPKHRERPPAIPPSQDAPPRQVPPPTHRVCVVPKLRAHILGVPPSGNEAASRKDRQKKRRLLDPASARTHNTPCFSAAPRAAQALSLVRRTHRKRTRGRPAALQASSTLLWRAQPFPSAQKGEREGETLLLHMPGACAAENPPPRQAAQAGFTPFSQREHSVPGGPT